MNRLQRILVGAIIIGVVASALTAFPLTNILLYDNADGWFTMNNIDDYGDDLDSRSNSTIVVFTGHPSYVMGSDDARLLFDMPRNHYFGTTFRGTSVGNDFFSRLERALRNGQAKYAVSGPMTEALLEQNASVQRAFEAHFCRVDDRATQRLYNQTHATLYKWVPEGECPPHRRPVIEDMGQRS